MTSSHESSRHLDENKHGFQHGHDFDNWKEHSQQHPMKNSFLEDHKAEGKRRSVDGTTHSSDGRRKNQERRKTLESCDAPTQHDLYHKTDDDAFEDAFNHTGSEDKEIFLVDEEAPYSDEEAPPRKRPCPDPDTHSPMDEQKDMLAPVLLSHPPVERGTDKDWGLTQGNSHLVVCSFCKNAGHLQKDCPEDFWADLLV